VAEKFYNLTNGVIPRRFVALAKPGLTELITRKIGESWLKDLNQLRDLEPFADDAQFQEKPESASAVSRKVLLEIVPVLIPAPPTHAVSQLARPAFRKSPQYLPHRYRPARRRSLPHRSLQS